MKRHRGFSLIELMVTLVVMGIVVAVGLPAFGTLSASLRQRESRDELLQRIRSARQSAITRHCPVIMAFGDGVHTEGIVSYRTHVDSNGDRIWETNEAASSYTLPRGCRLALASFTPTDTMVFDPSGALWPGTSGGRFYLTGGRRPDTLEVSATGMVYRP